MALVGGPERQTGGVPAEVQECFVCGLVLKADEFSSVARGTFLGPGGPLEAVLRRVDRVPWWAGPLARHLLRREAKALAVAGHIGVGPALLFAGRVCLIRSWIEALPLQLARPSEPGFFRSAKRVLRGLHRHGLTHNDLAKEQNWLCTPEGACRLTDFQLATRFSRRNVLFRIAAYEDLRHLLKHKRRYAPSSMRPRELSLLARKSLPTRLWMATFKRLYNLVTRRLLAWSDREGGGARMARDAPLLLERLRAHPGVREAAIVSFPDPRNRIGLYAFVEADLPESELTSWLAGEGARRPERLQVVAALPRTRGGAPCLGLLELIACNQIDRIGPLVPEGQQALVAAIVADRRNLRDRF